MNYKVSIKISNYNKDKEHLICDILLYTYRMETRVEYSENNIVEMSDIYANVTSELSYLNNFADKLAKLIFKTNGNPCSIIVKTTLLPDSETRYFDYARQPGKPKNI